MTTNESPIDAVMDRRSIVLDGAAVSSSTAIDEAGALLVDVGAVDQSYVSAMHDRERTASTFMGNGVAIPHGTRDSQGTVHRSAMSFVRYAKPLDWDGNPVHYVIGLAGRGDEHLALLQAIALRFADPEAVRRLASAASADDVLAVFTGNA